MTVTSVQKDLEARTMSLTVVDHDLTLGGTVSYVMTGPDGDKDRGWWRVLAVESPHHLEFVDGSADEAGTPDPGRPTMTTRVTLRAQPGGGTAMDMTSTFPTPEAMEQLLAMGMEEGSVAAVGQVDEILASQAA